MFSKLTIGNWTLDQPYNFLQVTVQVYLLSLGNTLSFPRENNLNDGIRFLNRSNGLRFHCRAGCRSEHRAE